ncbi:MAG: phosphatase PAP2 family protein [Candidatus Uhrbacteria bacterium]
MLFELDGAITRAVNGWAGHSPVLDAIGVTAAVWLIVPLVVLAIIFLIRAVRCGKHRIVIELIGTLILALLISQLIGIVAFRSRPFVDNVSTLLIAKDPTEKSFPSDHATMAFALVFSLWPLMRRRSSRVLLVGVAVLVALGRVYVGVHYVSDVIAGAALSFGVFAAVHYVSGRISRQRVAVVD